MIGAAQDYLSNARDSCIETVAFVLFGEADYEVFASVLGNIEGTKTD
jgi:O-acetyl-ADP-ribose deacetylase (regulator of RNase III)